MEPTTPSSSSLETSAPTPGTVAVLPIGDTVVFPEAVVPILVGKERSKRLVEDLLEREEPIVGLAVTEQAVDEPGPDELYEIGTVARVLQALRFPDGNYRLVVQGLTRARFGPYVQTHPFLAAQIEELPDRIEPTSRLEALQRQLLNDFTRIVEMTPYLSEQTQMSAVGASDGGRLADIVASSLSLDTTTRQELLELSDVEERLERLVRITAQELEILRMGSRIQEEVTEEMAQGQREFLLRKQLEAIRRELGEDEDTAAEADSMRERLDEAGLPEEALKEAQRELKRLENLPAASPEYHVIRTYIDWMVRFPWNSLTEDSLDVTEARGILDADHYGLDEVKERILEYLAVRRLKEDLRGPILCLVGAPGVGKTSLGKSIARALGREFVRMSLGGVRDEAESPVHRG